MTKPVSTALTFTQPSTTGVLQVDVPFTVNVVGLDANAAAKLCITGQLCQRSTTDDSGAFSQTWTLHYPGTYYLHVYQGQTPEQDPKLVFDTTLQLVNP